MKTRNKQFNISLTEREMERLVTVIKHHGITRTDFVVNAINNAFDSIQHDALRVPIVGTVINDRIIWNGPIPDSVKRLA